MKLQEALKYRRFHHPIYGQYGKDLQGWSDVKFTPEQIQDEGWQVAEENESVTITRARFEQLWDILKKG